MRWTRRCRARKAVSQGEEIRERSVRARRAALMRTAKSCGPGTRCWCQASRRFCRPNRARETIQSEGRRWQKEFVTGEITYKP